MRAQWPLAKKDQIRALLKSIETGDPRPISVVNEEKYIQHNPQTQEGSEGLSVLFKRLSKTSPRVNIVRAFEDGDFVFAHTEYDFSRRNIGFEVFRFKDGRAVEHWDNIQERLGPNPSGQSMVDGTIEAVDLEFTEINRAIVQSFVETVLIDGQTGQLAVFFNGNAYIEHNSRLDGKLSTLRHALKSTTNGARRIDYCKVHRILAEGSFILCIVKVTSRVHPVPFMISFESPDKNWWNTGTLQKKLHLRVNGRTVTENFDSV